jgi:hypothetical protein
MTWSGLAGLIILLGAERVCFAGTEDPSPGAHVATVPDDGSNPYSVISDRNVFHLNPPPPPPTPEQGPKPDAPEVFLSGFMRKGDQLKVLLVVKVKNPDKKTPPSNAYLTLAEGDKKSVSSTNDQVLVELVKAYAEMEKVDVVVAGTPMTLSLKDNGVANAAPRKATQEAFTMTDSLRKRHPFTSPAALALAGAKAAAPPAEAEAPQAGVPPVAVVPQPGEPPAAPEPEAANPSRAIIAGAHKEQPPEQP